MKTKYPTPVPTYDSEKRFWRLFGGVFDSCPLLIFLDDDTSEPPFVECGQKQDASEGERYRIAFAFNGTPRKHNMDGYAKFEDALACAIAYHKTKNKAFSKKQSKAYPPCN